MYVCARTLVSHNRKLAHKIAVWHLSLYSERNDITKYASYDTAQKFHKGAFHLPLFKISSIIVFIFLQIIEKHLPPTKNTADQNSHYKNLALFKAEPVYEGKLKVILGGIQQLRGQNFAIFTPPVWTVFFIP